MGDAIAQAQSWWATNAPWAKRMVKKAMKMLKGQNAGGKGNIFSACFGGQHASPAAAYQPAAYAGYPEPIKPVQPMPPSQPHATGYAAALQSGPAPVPTYVPAQQPQYYPAHVPAPAPTAYHAVSAEPTAAEYSDISLAAQKLYQLDDNRLQNGVDYAINVQNGKRAFDTTSDAAAQKLFRFVSPKVWDRPTFRLLAALRDNYHATTGQVETETAQERQEINAFLDAIMQTRPMQYMHKYVSGKGLAPADPTEFKRVLYQMWFSFYRREQQNDSCGFEHVFLGEIDNGQVSGFHNWIQFWIEEERGAVDYKGYIQPRNRDERVDDNERVLACQFTWNGMLKNVTTLFIGTSPEFEFALYTLYFLAGSERNTVQIEGYELCIRCYAIRSKYGDKIGSTFAELVSELSEHHG